MEVARPPASPEQQAEEKQPPDPPEPTEVRKEEDAANPEVASSAPGLAKSEDEEDEAGASPTSTCSWHGTPTWNDMTTFSQVWPLPFAILMHHYWCQCTGSWDVIGVANL